MVPGNTAHLCAFAPDDAKTISISIRRGHDGRSSSIVLPRDHHLAKHLERLVASETSPSRQQTAPLGYAPQQPEMQSDAVVRALSSVVKYINTNSRREGPSSSLSALFSSLQPPSEKSMVSVRHNDHSCPQTSNEVPSARVRRHRSGHGRTRITKHCKVIGCGNISVSRGLCRGHGGGRRCHYLGCSKSAQSRSVFCWAHGGGHRCEVESCMRRRKSKHFCADHVGLEKSVPDTMETSGPLSRGSMEPSNRSLPGATGNPCLPSLQEVLQNTQQSSMLL
ncbi:unnamed protein product [Phytophthora lilii]|uniref:Unnamed protein product n=1 Tax=Phytophthora lilii TaxID=2077276 RepID=A0A9W6WW04_9STRA|nr:unnamed protein product [Phytophthora lilii]